MTTPNPPANGATDWGTPLNDYLQNTLEAEIDQTTEAFSVHISAAPSTATAGDPHGDRAYALSLMTPILQNANQASGFVQLTSGGVLPPSILPTPDSWHDMRPVTSYFNATSTGTYPPQYRKTVDVLGNVTGVALAGYVYTTGSTYNGQLVSPNPLPSSYRPNYNIDLPVTASAAGTSASDQPAMVTIGSNGNVTISGLPAGLATGTAIGLFVWYPLDAAYTLIQS